MNNNYLLNLLEHNDLNLIKQELLKDMRIQELKRDGKYNIHQSIKKFIKTVPDAYENLRGIYYKNDKTCMCNGFIGIVLNDKIEPCDDYKLIEGFDLTNMMIKNFTSYSTIKRIDVSMKLKEIMSAVKVNKIKYYAPTPDVIFHYEIEGIFVNIKSLNLIMEMLGDCEIEFDKDNPISTIKFKSEIGKAILLPIRK